eukprot:scaffold11103_cov90-Isochrysis_galbana.AAC.2
MHALTPAVACGAFAGMSLVACAFVLAFVPETLPPLLAAEALAVPAPAALGFSRRSLRPHDSESGFGLDAARRAALCAGGPADESAQSVRLERSDSQDSALSEFNACAGNAKGWSASPTRRRSEDDARTSLL